MASAMPSSPGVRLWCSRPRSTPVTLQTRAFKALREARLPLTIQGARSEGRRDASVLAHSFTTATSSSTLVTSYVGGCSESTAPMYTESLAVPEECGDLLHPWLTGVQAHVGSVSAGVLIEDVASGSKLFVSAGLDKTVCCWRWQGDGGPAENDMANGETCTVPFVEVQKIVAPGGPLFSLIQAAAPQKSSISQGGDSSNTPHKMVFCGNAAKEVVAWEPFVDPEFKQFKLDQHTGWVRSLAMSGKFLFSCGCNFLRQWDTTYAVPKEVSCTKLFTGDILAIAADRDGVYTAGADGSLHSWFITDKNTGTLLEGASIPNAHDGRVCTLLLHDNMLFSSGCDGIIKAWNKGTLEPMGQAAGAHCGEKVQCMAMAPGGLLFSGGDDQMIRAWDTASLSTSNELKPANSCELAQFHNASVRMLVAGSDCLISGDSDGVMSFWRLGQAVDAAAEAEAVSKAALRLEAGRLEAALMMEQEAQMFSGISVYLDECALPQQEQYQEVQQEQEQEVVQEQEQEEHQGEEQELVHEEQLQEEEQELVHEEQLLEQKQERVHEEQLQEEEVDPSALVSP